MLTITMLGSCALSNVEFLGALNREVVVVYSLLKNISLKVKMLAFAGAMLVLMIIGYVYAISSMNSIGQELEAIAEEDIPLTEIVAAITEHQLQQAIVFERVHRLGAHHLETI
jgi:methyl-accepting chemotaxis protein